MYYKYISKVTIWPAEDKIAIPVFQSSSNFITSSMFEYGGWHRFSIEIDSHGGSTNSNSVNKNLQRPALIPLEFIISIMKQHKHKRQRFYFNYESSTWISYSEVSISHFIKPIPWDSQDSFLTYTYLKPYVGTPYEIALSSTALTECAVLHDTGKYFFRENKSGNYYQRPAL